MTPAFDQGEMDVKPSPAPAARSISEIDALTTAPPNTVLQDTAEEVRVAARQQRHGGYNLSCGLHFKSDACVAVALQTARWPFDPNTTVRTLICSLVQTTMLAAPVSLLIAHR